MKVIVAEFETDDIEKVDAHLRLELDLSKGKLRYEKNKARNTVEAQFFLLEDLDDWPGVVDLLAQMSHIAFAGLLGKRIIRNYEGLSVYDFTDGKWIHPEE